MLRMADPGSRIQAKLSVICVVISGLTILRLGRLSVKRGHKLQMLQSLFRLAAFLLNPCSPLDRHVSHNVFTAAFLPVCHSPESYFLAQYFPGAFLHRHTNSYAKHMSAACHDWSNTAACHGLIRLLVMA